MRVCLCVSREFSLRSNARGELYRPSSLFVVFLYALLDYFGISGLLIGEDVERDGTVWMERTYITQ